MAVVFGGDGAILSTCRKLGRNRILDCEGTWGDLVFSGTHGKDVCVSLEKIFTGSYHVRKRTLLLCRVERDGKIIDESMGINDAVISRSSLSRLIFLKLNINGEKCSFIFQGGRFDRVDAFRFYGAFAICGRPVNTSIYMHLLSSRYVRTLTNRPLVVFGDVRDRDGTPVSFRWYRFHGGWSGF